MKSQRKPIEVILLIIAVIAITSCGSPLEEKDIPTTFSGEITNGEIDTVFLYGFKTDAIKIVVDSNKFSDTIEAEEGYYRLKIGNQYTEMYWDNEFQINLMVDMKEFDESLAYNGTGSAENKVLKDIFLLKEEYDSRSLYMKTESNFLDTAAMLRDQIKAIVDSAKVGTAFANDQRSNADYEYNSNLYRYESYHPYYNLLDSFKVSEGFYDNLIPFNKDNGQTYVRSSVYRNLLTQYIQNESQAYWEEEKSSLEAAKGIIEQFKDPNVIDGAIAYFSYGLLKAGDDLEESYAFMSKVVSDSAELAKYAEAYETLQNIQKGMPSPSFNNYENHAGGTTSLSDLKGKYVYIDVWATWCGPCLAEIPSLKEREEEYASKNIQFVSISIDQKAAHQTWVDMVNNKELGGIQLYADNAWNSDFVKDYYIRGIPRFILIDPEGKIVSSDAPRPSNPELKELLDGLLEVSS